MDTIALTNEEQWQVRAMATECQLLATKLALAQQLQATALTGILARHGGDGTRVYTVSADGQRLEVVK